MDTRSGQKGKPNTEGPEGWQELKRHDLMRGLRRELRDIYHFYIDPERRESLSKMHRLVRWVYVVIWIGMSMLAKLTPLRRLLLVISLVMALTNVHYSLGRGGEMSINFGGLGFTLLLIVLLLELKDKLLFQNELVAGKAVQEALLPKQNPVLPGWDLWLYTRPANEVGGDLVDYVMLPEGKLAVCLGDVAGKGLGAALCMAKVQATLRALVDTTPSLRSLGRRLNEILCRDSLPQRFVSLVVAALSARRGKVQMLNAGHLPPLLIKEGQCAELPRGEAALGLNPKTRYRTKTHRLEKGDLLVLYSDGLTDCRNERLEPFGETRLYNALLSTSSASAREIGEHLVAEVERFVGEARFEDDFSIAILKRTA
ncbi:MAG: serine/threonine-protein phosphatase [candidate division KSB1 bacterium]|nr:serine/threonine-protein phosphatase [candidate division KSB1 bacterium]MDZ7393001.1 serine/threonine-protein phosphatase [candidate division KSB1 bacterium]MDZ7413540.1 serine/threonine-protein phosphatase [candidate division KSB1 bacterium]